MTRLLDADSAVKALNARGLEITRKQLDGRTDTRTFHGARWAFVETSFLERLYPPDRTYALIGPDGRKWGYWRDYARAVRHFEALTRTPGEALQ